MSDSTLLLPETEAPDFPYQEGPPPSPPLSLPLPPLRQALSLAFFFAAIKLAIQIAVNLAAPRNGYGLFRDELYYIMCGRHLAWGYVDHPPMVALQALLADSLFGHDHLWAFRIFSAGAGAAMVFLTGLLCRTLGGRPRAQALAMVGSLAAVVNLPLDSFLSMNAFEPVFWMTALLAVLMMARGASPRWWLLFGVAAGLGIENKHSQVFFLMSLLAGLLLTPQRRLLRNRYALAGVVILVLLAMPNLLWQWHHGFPTLEWLLRIRRLHKIVVLGPLAFVLQQVLVLNPVSLLLWGAGLGWLLFGARARSFRFAGVMYLVFLPLMFALHAKDYYLAPIYPVYFAAGGVAWQLGLRRWWQRRILVPAYVVFFCCGTLVYAPLLLPVLPRAHYAAYQHLLHFKPTESENFQTTVLPQFLADMTGWSSFTAQISAAYNALPPATRAQTGIFCGNYGEAGAVDVLGPENGLPPAISGNQNYWFWGPAGQLKENMLIVGQTRSDVEKSYTTVREVGRTHLPDAITYEDNMPIWFATGRRRSPNQLWPETKDWY